MLPSGQTVEAGGNELANQIAALTTQTAALASAVGSLVYWMRIVSGAGITGIILILAVLYRVVRIERDHGPVIRRLSAEQRARASHDRAVAARRASRSDNDQPPH